MLSLDETNYKTLISDQTWIKCPFNQGSKGGTAVRALASQHCVVGLIPVPGVICGFSLLLVLQVLWFPPPSKTNIKISKFQFDPEFKHHRFISHKAVRCYPQFNKRLSLHCKRVLFTWQKTNMVCCNGICTGFHLPYFARGVMLLIMFIYFITKGTWTFGSIHALFSIPPFILWASTTRKAFHCRLVIFPILAGSWEGWSTLSVHHSGWTHFTCEERRKK